LIVSLALTIGIGTNP